MVIQKWNVIDIHYNDNEEKEARRYEKSLIRQGYSLEHLDEGAEHDNCDQLIKWFNRIHK